MLKFDFESDMRACVSICMYICRYVRTIKCTHRAQKHKEAVLWGLGSKIVQQIII